MAANIESANFNIRSWEAESKLSNIDTYHFVNFLPDIDGQEPCVAHYLISTTPTETRIERFEDYELLRIKRNLDAGKKPILSETHTITTLTKKSERPFILTLREGPNQQRRVIRIRHR